MIRSAENLRVAMFTDTYEPQVNGVVRSIKAFSTELARRGHAVHIFAPHAHGQPAGQQVHLCRSVRFRAYPEYRIGIPSPGFEIAFRRQHFDVIHVHSPFSLGALGLGLARKHHIPLVGTFHTILPEYAHYVSQSGLLSGLIRSFGWRYCKWFYNRCNVVIAPSEEARKILTCHGVRKPLSVVPTGIQIKDQLPKSKAAIRKQYSLGPEKIVLHVGRITREKNIELIIDAVKDLPSTKLIIASDGPHRATLEAYAKMRSVDALFTGYLSEQALDDMYSMADVFVMTSMTETQGLVLLEAAAHGLPIVVLDTPVLARFVRENRVGLVADRQSLARAIEQAVQTPLGSLDLSKYSIEHCTDQLLSIYSKVSHSEL